MELADETIGSIRSYKNKINNEDNSEIYGVTKERILYEGGPTCYAQIIWSAERYASGRLEVEKRIQAEREKLEAFITASSGKSLTEEELKWVPSYFVLRTEPGEPKIEIKKKRGRGGGTTEVEIPTLKILAYEDDEAGINNEYMKSGIFVLITRKRMTAQETLDAYAKRDCVEKVFEALKSHLGMDKIGVTTEEAMHGKGLIWFIASIFHAILFNGTKKLRVTNRKYYTVPAIVDSLEAIKADKNLTTNKYKRRYKVTARQGKVLNCWGITEADIDERINMIQSE